MVAPVDSYFAGRLGWLVRLAAMTLFVASSSGAGFAQKQRAAGRLAPELQRIVQGGSTDQRVQVIVQFRHSLTQAAQVRKVQDLGGTHLRHLGLLKGSVFSLPVANIKTLASDPEVAYITPDRRLRASNDYFEMSVGGDVAQNLGYDGTGIGVAVIDSGVSDHADLHDPVTGNSRVVYSESFVPGTDARDQYGHGTQVAGIITGNGTMSGGKANAGYEIFGVAPNVRIINLKVLDGNGVGQDSYVISALQRAIALKSTYNIRVVNLSLGRPVFESYKQDPLCQAVEQAWKAGLTVVVAAGNEGRNNSFKTQGYGLITAPGNDPYVITVGAMRTMDTYWKSDDLVATYSSKGPTLFDHIIKPDVVAPGNRIASLLVPGSTLDTLFPQNEVNPIYYGPYAARQYLTLSGTSMAAPVVSGTAALMEQKDSSASPDTVKARLMKTADKSFPATSSTFDSATGITYNEQYDIFTIGAGYLNIPNALASTDVAAAKALSPVAVRNSDGSVSLQANSSLFGVSVIWGNSVIWGTSVIWGNCLLSGSSVIWGNSVVWGNTTMSGNSVIWGGSVVWGNSNTNGDSATAVLGRGDDNQ